MGPEPYTYIKKYYFLSVQKNHILSESAVLAYFLYSITNGSMQAVVLEENSMKYVT